MASLTLSSAYGFANGSEQIGSPVVGYLSSTNYVLRYSFKTPANGYITSLTFATIFNRYMGIASVTYNVRVKITESSTSHINAGTGTSDYNGTMGVSGTADISRSCTINGLWLKPNTTYYVFLFPGSQDFAYSCFDYTGADLSSLSYNSIVATYTLSLSAGEGTSISVSRTSSPSGSTGALSNGATLYTGDVLKIITSVSAGYEITKQTVNGSAFSSGVSYNVSSNVTIVTVAGVLGIIYIDTGSALEKFLIYIDNGSSWDQYVPYVDNGSGWSSCH